LHRDIAVFDFKSLYPSMMASRNISWETKRTQGYEVDFSVPKNLRDWEKGTASVCYSKNDLGILPKAVLSMMKLRDEYKVNRKNAKNDEEYRKWDSAQMATKRAVNAFYGVLAKDGYGWGDMEMAQSITASAREAMRSVAFKAIELGYKVIYGHTDSIFVQVKDVDDAEALCLLLNQYIRNEVFNECVELEFEKYAKTFFLSKKKNRYCGYLSWKDGEYIDDEFFVMGFEMKKSNETKIAKTFQKTVLQMVASSKSEEEVTDYARKLYKEIIKGDVDFKEVIKRSRLRTPLGEYKSIAGGVAGVLFYNEQGIGEIEVGDSYYFYTVNNKLIKGYPRRYEFEGRIRDVDYIACKKIDEVIDNFPINWERIAESEIVKKVNLIYDSLDWNLNEISQTGKQLSLSEWW
jgi:DNA polymerase elongation subunit (family B)